MDNAPIDRNFFDKLTDSSFAYLSDYYRQTEKHANRAFVAALSMAIFGGSVVVCGVIAVFFGCGNASYISVGCGVIVQFLSAVMFALYYKTVSNMKKYHNSLISTLDLAIALKTADSMEKGSDEAKLAVIQSISQVYREKKAFTDDENDRVRQEKESDRVSNS